MKHFLELALVGYLALVVLATSAVFAVGWATRRRDERPPEVAEPPKADDLMAVANAFGLPRPAVPQPHRYSVAETDELVEAFNWGRYSTWLQDPAPKERT